MRSPDGGGNTGGRRPPERRGRPGGPTALTTPPAVATLTELRSPLNLLTTMPQEAPISRDSEILEECQKAIGYRFQQPVLLRGALTHASGANTRLSSNERLEFLGDAVLGLVVCEQLFQRFPDFQEGDMTKVKSVVVSRRTCARISRMLHLGDFLFLGKGMHVHTDVPASLQA